uniref:Neurotransmitter-gated ion-channel transmembrane domain-containing protein n=1 Tax=Strigamia maritima TaxID=126957 RepID=T1IZK7_STRMM
MHELEVRFKVTDPKAHGKGVENTINPPSGGGGGDAEAGERAGAGAGAGTGGGGDPNTFQGKNLNKLCGISPSDIDKYSRVVFPVCFVCFNLMYWIIYLHISDVIVEDIVPISAE